MTCPNCGKKFVDPPFQCIDCGTELGWKCTSCQHGNPVHYRFCGKCGTPIPVGLSSIIDKGEQLRVINIPQYNEAIITELMEERQRNILRRQVKNLNQTDIDELFAQ